MVDDYQVINFKILSHVFHPKTFSCVKSWLVLVVVVLDPSFPCLPVCWMLLVLEPSLVTCYLSLQLLPCMKSDCKFCTQLHHLPICFTYLSVSSEFNFLISPLDCPWQAYPVINTLSPAVVLFGCCSVLCVWVIKTRFLLSWFHFCGSCSLLPGHHSIVFAESSIPWVVCVSSEIS